jgi:hypothetical protein
MNALRRIRLPDADTLTYVIAGLLFLRALLYALGY